AGDVVGRLAAGAAVAEQIPVSRRCVGLRRRLALVATVIPLDEGGVGDGVGCEAGQLTGAGGARQGGGGDVVDGDGLEPTFQVVGVVLALVVEWQIGAAGVLVRVGPGGVAVPDEVEQRQIHGRTPVRGGR